ncbi:penicillin-binding protein 2 [Patescibacteria group bacterium]|nr:penicillin-binding protein 2 [Patescibacteria group bacterium]
MKNWRIYLVFVFLIIFGAGIIIYLFDLQIIKHKFYQAQALGQQTVFEEVEGNRGRVFFKNAEKSLAVNNDNRILYANPQLIDNKEETALILSEIIKIPSSQILAKIEKENSSYSTIKSKLEEEEINKIENLGLEGIYLELFPGRYYPQEKIAAPVIGFLGGDQVGQYGLEGYYDEILKGEKSFKEEPRTLVLFNPQKFEPFSLDGSDLYLTVDYNIQFEVESLLKEAKEKFDIDSGQIIVMDPKTGQVVAMADFPSFDPNQYSKEKDLDIFQNDATQKIFEPGSVLKPITMAIALNEGKITPDTTYIDEGFVKVGISTIYNFDKTKKYGTQTMTQILENSLNTGAIFVSRLINPDVYLEYIDKFGLNEKTGIDLQGEVYSRNENLRKGQEINFATASFGQGIEMTPIQLTRAFCVIANGGKLIKPYIVDKIVSSQKEETETKPKIINEVISQQTASQLTTMLISAVNNGFAKKAGVAGYYVAGKTGTAQVAFEDKKGYYPDKTIHSFVGFAPALNPRFVVLVKLNNPKGKSSGETAAPIFSELAQYIFNYWQIPPDYEQ